MLQKLIITCGGVEIVFGLQIWLPQSTVSLPAIPPPLRIETAHRELKSLRRLCCVPEVTVSVLAIITLRFRIRIAPTFFPVLLLTQVKVNNLFLCLVITMFFENYHLQSRDSIMNYFVKKINYLLLLQRFIYFASSSNIVPECCFVLANTNGK